MFKSAATKIAHNSTIPALAGNKDLKPLQDLILAEKAVIISLQRLSADFSRASEALKAWGLGEGEDLGNILGASTAIFTHFTSALSQYASHGHTMREQLKAIRTREENLDELKRRRRSVISKAESAGKKLQKMSPEHKNLVQQTDLLSRLQEEIRGLDTEIMRDEAAIGDFKRSATRSWMGLKFGGLLEFCEKGVIAGEFGKLVISEIPEDETQPGLPRNTYLGHTQVEELVAETHRCVNEVRLSTVPSSAQPRRIDQQLPQVPNVSESPFMNQGSFSPPRTDPFADDTTRREALPDTQGFGTARFLDSPTEPVSNTFPQSQHQPQYSGSLSSASAFQSQQYGHGVDEFGTTNPTGPIDAPNAGGGRFATFPVKGRSGSMGATSAGGPMAFGGVGGSQFQSHFDDKEPLSLLSAPPPRRNSDSFSSSVAQALAASEHARGTQDEPLPKPGRFSKDGPAPSYEASIDSDPNPWASQKLGANLSPSAHARQTSNLSDDEALLVYMSPGNAATATATTNAPQDRGSSSVSDRHVSRHVRFGDVSEIDEEPPLPITPQDNSSFGAPSLPSESTAQGRTSFDNRADASGGRGPAAVMARNPDDQERALNAAAAREIALELNIPSGAPPTLVDSPVPSSSPVGRQSVSPRPEYATSISVNSIVTPTDPAPSYTEELHSPPSIAQQYSGASAGSGSASAFPPAQQIQASSYPLDSTPRFSPGTATYATPPQLHLEQHAPLPSPYEQEFDPYEEHTHQEKGQGYGPGQAHVSSPTSRTNLPPLPQQQGNAPGTYSYYEQGGGRSDARPSASPVLSLVHTPSPPLEQPNAPYLRSGSGSRASSTSLNATSGAGGGKISAAAFKRPSPRHGSSSSPFGPPSPTPFGSSGAGFGPGLSPSAEGGRRLPSPYGADQPQGYAPQGQGQGQQVQPLHIKKRASDNPDVDQYDYANTYAEGGGDEHGQGQGQGQGYDDGYHAGQIQRAASANAGGGGWAGIGAGGGGGGGAGGAGRGGGGYGQGRFATNLEDGSLL